MPLSIEEQAKNLITKAENILLVAHAKMDGDTLSSASAMHLLLRKLGKKTTLVCADPVPEALSFLPASQEVRREFDSSSEFVITLDCSKTTAKKLRWKTVGSALKIFVAPETGIFTSTDVSFSENANFDLVIALDAADKKQLGSIFEENAELFSRVPLLVFDHHASNDGFGTVNIIDTTSASTTEVLFHFLPTLFGEDWKRKIDADIATLLLTGIITDTGSFQNPNTTPRSLEVAADLAELGARQQEIIRHIFKTKNIPTLKLWGRVLSKIKTDPVHRLLWSTVSSDDLADTEGHTDDLEGIGDELLATAPGVEMVILIKEREDGIIATSVRTTTPLCDATEFCSEFGGGGHPQAAGFKIRGGKAFEVAVGEIISAAQHFQKRRLGIGDAASRSARGEVLPETFEKEITPESLEEKGENVEVPQEEEAVVEVPKPVEDIPPLEIEEEISETPTEENVEEEKEDNAIKNVEEHSPKEGEKIEEEKEEAAVTPPTPGKEYVEIPEAKSNASPEKAENSAFNAMQNKIGTDVARTTIPEIPHEEFTSMLEKMMRIDPAEHTKSSDQKQ